MCRLDRGAGSWETIDPLVVVELMGADSEPTRLVEKVGAPRENRGTCDIVNIP